MASPAALRNYDLILRRLTGQPGNRTEASVLPHGVEAASRKPEWSAAHRANYLSMVQMPYRWACRMKLLSTPMEGLRKPPGASRGVSSVISDRGVRSPPASRRGGHPRPADPRLLWATGARPAEVAGLTAEQVRASADGVILVAAHKSAHTGKVRFLILTGEALEVARCRAAAVTSRLLFPSEMGGRLTAQAIAHRLKKPCRQVGVRHLIPYGFRHAFATDALARGVPDATAAALWGHSPIGMLHRHYTHLTVVS